MNRLVVENPERFEAASLPPRERKPGGPLRLLFITSYALGFRTLSKQFEQYTASRTDVDAVHIRLAPTGALRYLNASINGLHGWDLVAARSLLAWRLAVGRLFRRGLDPACFDAAVVTTQTVAPAMVGVKRRSGLPFAVYVDVTNAQCCRELGAPAPAEVMVRRTEKRIFNEAAFVAGMSDWALDSVASDYGIPREKLLLVRNAVPVAATPVLPPARPPASGKVKIAFVGNDWHRKGGDRLLAWHQQHWTDKAELHIVSSAAPVDPTARAVCWHGAVPNDRLMGELLPSMDIFALPTRQDMSPWAVIEASGLGLPVVSSRIGALEEIVLHERTGLLCPPGDDAAFIAAIERLMADAPLRTEMGIAARKHILEEFSPEKCYGALLSRLAAAARPVPAADEQAREAAA